MAAPSIAAVPQSIFMSASTLLRPMTVGDILDQAIRLYRKNFVTLVGIVAIVSVPLLLINVVAALFLLQNSPFNQGVSGESFSSPDPLPFVAWILVTIITAIVGAVAGVFEIAALAVVVSERYLGNATTIRQAYGRVLKRWLSLFMVIIIIGLIDFALFTFLLLPTFGFGLLGAGLGGPNLGGALAAFGILCACLGFIPALLALIYLNIHWLFAIQAIVLENQNSTGGMRRSWRLVRGSFWRVLGIAFIISIIVLFFTLGPTYLFAVVSLAFPSVVLSTVVNTIVTTTLQILISPIQLAALTLLYYDLRIRKEGFDIQQRLLASAEEGTLPLGVTP